jgi:hypothetical protein
MTTVAEARKDMNDRLKGEHDFTAPKGIEVVAEVGTIVTRKPRPFKSGQEIRVAVKTAGEGEPAVDIRKYLTPAGDITAKGYTGPTKEGFWLTVIDAEVLCGMLGDAVIMAETEIQRRDDTEGGTR